MNKKPTKFFNQEQRKWVLIDAKDKVLGRLSTRIAQILTGKNKATYTPNSLCGDKVIVINAKYLKFTGNKINDKFYDKYSGYPDGRNTISLKLLLEKNPNKVLYYSVRGMLPKSWLGKRMIRSLRIYQDDIHMQVAQKPPLVKV